MICLCWTKKIGEKVRSRVWADHKKVWADPKKGGCATVHELHPKS